MNPKKPLTPREEIEMRLTALLLGELSPEEAAAIEALMARDPDLAALHGRLRKAMDLLREATALPEPSAPPTPVQLSSERRERLLAHFQTPAPIRVPASVVRKPRQDWSWAVPLSLAAVLVVVIGGGLLMPVFSTVQVKAGRAAPREMLAESEGRIGPVSTFGPIGIGSFESARRSSDVPARNGYGIGSLGGIRSGTASARNGYAMLSTPAPSAQEPRFTGNVNVSSVGNPPPSRPVISAVPSTMLAADAVTLSAKVPHTDLDLGKVTVANVDETTAAFPLQDSAIPEDQKRPFFDDSAARGTIAGGTFTASSGTLVLNGANTYTGSTTINGGTLSMTSGATVSSTTIAQGTLSGTPRATVAGNGGIANMGAGTLTVGGTTGGGTIGRPAEDKAADSTKGLAEAQLLEYQFQRYPGHKSILPSESQGAPASGAPAPIPRAEPVGVGSLKAPREKPDSLNADALTAGNRSGNVAISPNAIDALLFPESGKDKLAAPAVNAPVPSPNADGEQVRSPDDKTKGKGIGSMTSGELLERLNHEERKDELEKLIPGTADSRTKQLFTEAQGFYDNGRFALAKKRTEQILNSDPNNQAARDFEKKIDRTMGDYGVMAWARPIRKFNAPTGASAAGTETKAASENSDVLVTKEWKVPPDLIPRTPHASGAATLSLAGPATGHTAGDATLGGTGIAERESAKNWLIANGVQFNGNASAVYLITSNRLIVRNTEDQLDLVESIVGSKAHAKAEEAAKPVASSLPIRQPEIQTRENPFSTFSLNVSDVSFKLAAASLEQGRMPDPATVRSEEFVNAFDYRDPEPAPGVPLAFATDRARYPFAQNRDLLRFAVKTAAAGRQPGRPLNVVLLLDKSGSMERADRVAIVREALRVLAAQLQPQDKLSIVTFARTPRLWADGVAGDKAGELIARVGEITPEGGTNLEAALDLGYKTALRHYAVGSINRVVLFTDGAANLGEVNPDTLTKKVEAHRKQGVALDCFGIGWEGYNDDLLEQLTRHGDGRYGFINAPDEAAENFAAQLAGALQVAASDVKVQVEFNPRRVTAYRQIGYAKHQLTKEQFRDNSVVAAQIGAAESGNALYVVEVDPRGEGDLATVRVRFRVPGTDDVREHEWPVPFTGNAEPLEQASSALRLAGTASAFSEMLAGSPYAAEVTSERLLGVLHGVPAIYGADPRPKKLEWMVRQTMSLSGR